MLQFYFLSILLNVLTGLVFIYAAKGTKSSEIILSDSDESPVSDGLDLDSAENDSLEDDSEGKISEISILNDKTFRMVLGILMLLTGLLKLLSPIEYDIAFIGDLIPSLAGLAGGASLLIEWYEERTSISVPLPEILQTAFVDGRKYLGFFCIAAGALHFIFPRVLFL